MEENEEATVYSFGNPVLQSADDGEEGEGEREKMTTMMSRV